LKENWINLKVVKGKEIHYIKALKEKSIMQNLIYNNIKMLAPCNSKGTCGKCKIKIVEGQIEKRKSNDTLLSLEEIERGICLACASYVLSHCTIEILDFHDEEFEILQEYNKENVDTNTGIEVFTVKIDGNDFENSSLSESVKCQVNRELEFSLESLKKLSSTINESSKNQYENNLYKEKIVNVITEENRVIDVCSVENTKAYGIAVDIGTTTIVLSVVDLLTGEVMDTDSILNSQRQFGADVISRIQYGTENSIYVLRNSLRKDIIQGIEKLCVKIGINTMSVYKMVVAANTTMLHLLMGLFCESMTAYPFTTVTNSEVKISFKELFENTILNCEVVLLQGISAYIGADITSGMSKCNFHKAEDICMLIDIGTNGEMAIGNKEKIKCLAAAAGPAFEAANIQNGIGSVSGAIYSVNIENGKISYKTINNKKAIGICGSAVIDIVAQGIKNNLIDKTGKFNKDIIKEKYIKIVENEEKIIFTQKDVRELQLAKSAIRSGIETLIENFDCSCKDIKTVYLAGGFGNNINIDNAVTIGIIPSELKKKICCVGNTSLGGSINYLLNINTKKNIKHIVDSSKCIDISTDESFNNLFIKNINFT
jgi:uncharacterized 2Fe-2S/4Fe-4S cluster protein (DUF4445 family)